MSLICTSCATRPDTLLGDGRSPLPAAYEPTSTLNAWIASIRLSDWAFNWVAAAALCSALAATPWGQVTGPRAALLRLRRLIR